MALLEVKNLTVQFETARGPLQAVQSVSFEVREGEAMGIVGESGSGKSVTSLAVMDLLPPQGKVVQGDILLMGKSLLKMSEAEKQKLRGHQISMVFQDPMTSLNPSFRVGDQITEAMAAHFDLSRSAIHQRARDLLMQVGIPDPDARLTCYPHQLSGGMNQRIMIAMAISCDPKILIADEPTTALDVTIQSQILNLLFHLQKKNKMSLVLITHDLGVVAENTDDLVVMYAGQVMEFGPTLEILSRPSHPYTEGLLQCIPGRNLHLKGSGKLPTIAGVVPDLVNRPTGCQLHPRCKYQEQICQSQEPALRPLALRHIKCHKPIEGLQQEGTKI